MIKKVGLIIIAIVTIFNLILPLQTAYAAETKKENVNEVMGGISNESADSLMNDGKTTANPEGGSSKHKVSPEPSMETYQYAAEHSRHSLCSNGRSCSGITVTRSCKTHQGKMEE